jgi:Co/Zn/Cd efflux system component
MNSETHFYRTEFKVPKMDCPAEEQMIRMALDDVDGIRGLEFDLENRCLVVWHSTDTDTVTSQLAGLNLGTMLIETAEKSESQVPASESTGSERKEARVLWILLGINGLMFMVELVSGWLVESTGLIADSLDMLADAAVYGISLYAVGRAARHKLRAAHLSGWFQFALALGALFEVLRRFVVGSEPDPPYMMGVAFVALTANVTCLWLIAKHRDKGAHMKASWIFSTNDVIANLGVIVAGILVSVTGSRYPDLAVGCIIATVVFIGSIRILRLGK